MANTDHLISVKLFLSVTCALGVQHSLLVGAFQLDAIEPLFDQQIRWFLDPQHMVFSSSKYIQIWFWDRRSVWSKHHQHCICTLDLNQSMRGHKYPLVFSWMQTHSSTHAHAFSLSNKQLWTNSTWLSPSSFLTPGCRVCRPPLLWMQGYPCAVIPWTPIATLSCACPVHQIRPASPYVWCILLPW